MQILTPEVGDIITYTLFGGGERTVRVTDVLDDVKNGIPGFDGVEVNTGANVWGYNDQITVVHSSHPSVPMIGEQLDNFGTILAHSVYTEDEQGVTYAVVVLLDRSKVTVLDANYAVLWVHADHTGGPLTPDMESPMYHRNLVMASECYADDFGADV